jgi:hypothetical protein
VSQLRTNARLFIRRATAQGWTVIFEALPEQPLSVVFNSCRWS